jgi:hypothetical protein
MKSAACLRADFLVGSVATLGALVGFGAASATSSDFLGFFALVGAASDAPMNSQRR